MSRINKVIVLYEFYHYEHEICHLFWQRLTYKQHIKCSYVFTHS